MAQRQFRPDDTSTWVERYGNGADGALTISADTTFAEPNQSLTGTASSTSATIGASGSFANGDLVLIHQTKGTGAGNWELNKIASGGGTTSLTLAYALINTYGTGAQIVKLKQYSSVAVNSGKVWSAPAWDGTKGGILAFLCNGTVSITGTINASIKGFRGGQSQTSNNATGYSGEGYGGDSYAGTSVGTYVQTATGHNGGSPACGHNAGQWNPEGGPGGGNGTVGSANSAHPGTQVSDAETGGSTAGNTGLTLMHLGGGAGSGGSKTNGPSGKGGTGGGIVFCAAPTITVSGAITSAGETGDDAAGSNNDSRSSGGGGGAGGSVLLKGDAITIGTTLITCPGGSGGQGYTGGAERSGGIGGSGRVHIDYSTSLSGTSTPTLNSTQDSYYSPSTTYTQALTANATGTASIATVRLFFQALTATATGSASIATATTYLKELVANATATVILGKGYFKTLIALATGSASIDPTRGGVFAIEINGNDRSTMVRMGSVRKRENLNQLIDTLSFTMEKYGTRDYTPAEGDSINFYDPDGTLIFSGYLNSITKSLDGASLLYACEFVSWAGLFGSRNVLERYEETTGAAIIADLLATYAPEFTGTAVVADFPVESISFNRISLTAALEKLAKLSNYSWYVDYEKDLHFFPKYQEPAPFDITDHSANFEFESLTIADDYSQLRNRVFVRGGEVVGNERTERYIQDGDASQTQFPLANKFSELPVVEVDGSPITVGVDFLTPEDEAAAFWSFQQKYIRFKDDTKPTAGQEVAITGTPLYRLTVQVEDAASITRLGGYDAGVREFAIDDPSIKTEVEARDRAQAQLDAYASKVMEASLTTTTPGLRAGQVITINSPRREVAGDFLVQSVALTTLTPSRGYYTIHLATLRTLSILDILIAQVGRGEIVIDDRDTEILERFYSTGENVGIAELVARDTDSAVGENLEIDEEVARNMGEPEFVFAPYIPTGTSDTKVKGRFGDATFG